MSRSRWGRRARCAWAAAVLASYAAGAGGCATTHHVARDEPVSLAPNEGVLLLPVDSERLVEVISLCRERDLLDCVDVTNVPATPVTRVQRLSEGLWCIERVVLQLTGPGAGVLLRVSGQPRTPCIRARAGGVSHAGTLVLRTASSDDGLVALEWGFAHGNEPARARLAVEYPHLVSLPFYETDVEER